ncbi:rho GTPase-activating protein 21-like isoform X2 [Gadus chalcogrammus]|uniref:rho GTPase-activating protein 21-like isoform X2 n=1 Tax=Gadus chalcogrammus TaxID=1042646 RepID=UPI0024C4CD28|nr:rho GTPase-activating protein 21-like isoform X2 [Gadus chalcogrammus]
MLAQRSGPTPGPKPAPVTDDPDLAETREGTVVGRQSPSPPASPGSSCPWARLAGVDGCLVEPYCLWFQLLARAYWGDVELGGGGPVRCMSWARLRDASRRNCVCSKAKRKDGRDQSETSTAPSPGGEEEEPFSWPGPKTLRLQRTSQGFGFTLRHFIVYPPESAVHCSRKDDDNCSRGSKPNRLEPMDTIFVKQVKEGGPANGAGLCTGDRIVKVNGESIIGKTYSQVIALIQNSDASLELCVMPKDEDILQLAYSQDAYLKGHDAYSGNARHIPAPPPLCYPRIEAKAPASEDGPAPLETEPPAAPQTPAAHQPSPKTQTVVCVCNESVRTVLVTPDPGEGVARPAVRAGPSHRTEEPRHAASPQPGPEPGSTNRGTVATATLVGAGSVRSTGSPLVSGSRPTLSGRDPPPSKTASPGHNHYPPSSPVASPSPRQSIDWRNYTTYKDYIDAKRLHSYGNRSIQERLDSLRAAAGGGSAYSLPATPSPPGSAQRGQALGSQVRRRSTSHDRGTEVGRQGSPVTPSPLSPSQEKTRAGGGAVDAAWGPAAARTWSRSLSHDALHSATPTGGPTPRARSCDFLGRRPGETGAGVVPGDQAGCSRPGQEARLLQCQGEGARAGLGAPPPQEKQGRGAGRASSVFTKCLTDPALAVGRPSRPPAHSSTASEQSPSEPPADHPKDQRAVVMGNHLAHASLQHLQLRGRADSLRMDSRQEGAGGAVPRSSSCSGSASKLPAQRPLQSAAVSSPSGLAKDGDSPATLRSKVKEFSDGGSTSAPTVRTGAAGVVLRRRECLGLLPLRPPSYVLAVNDLRGAAASPPCSSQMGRSCPAIGGAGKQTYLPSASRREPPGRRLGEARRVLGSDDLNDSLDSIPFIDEPSSPSVDHDTLLIPACAVISGTPVITTVPSSPTVTAPLIRRQRSHDQGSFCLTVTDSDSASRTERSKSYDEGLDFHREEARGSLISGLKGLKKVSDCSSEDSGSRRDSSSDTFCTATKEGLLHFKQLHSDKNKRGGGGMRPWKQMYAVLRGHSLCLYRDRKEAQAHTHCPLVDEPQPISIKACLVDISYSDTKRKNVLRLTTSDCEFLFQAEDREDMLAWIRVIQENLDHENAVMTSRDLISRKIKEYNTLMSPTGSKTEVSPKVPRQSLRNTLMGGNREKEGKASGGQSPKAEAERQNLHRGESSPPKDKGTWRARMKKQFDRKHCPGLTFGVRLDDCPPAQTNQFVPLIVEVCCRVVEERGLEYTGIYRVPGNNTAISSLQDELNHKGLAHIDTQDDKWRDLNVISSLLKSFFRKLPEPLFTNEKYADFIEANRIEDPAERLKAIKRLLHELPDHHYQTLKFLSAHLKAVADNSEKNKMEPRNLAIVFGPTLVRRSEDNMTDMVTHMPDQYRIVETLIHNYDWFFTNEDSEEPVMASRDQSAVESQPVPNIDHLLTNIGRTCASQGEVSDSATSDSAKSKGSLGPGREGCSRELLVSSIFAVASRKRRKSKEKLPPSSSDEDLDAVLPEPGAAQTPDGLLLPLHQAPLQGSGAQYGAQDGGQDGATEQARAEAWRKENGRSLEVTKKEHRNSFFSRALSRQPSPSPSPSPKPPGAAGPGARAAATGAKSSLSDETASDLGTGSSGASAAAAAAARSRPRKWTLGAWSGGGGGGAAAGAEVSSITSDYSTTSSVTFLTGAESGAECGATPGGEEADDERSELLSEGRPALETDSESDFPVFAPQGGSSQSTPRPDTAGGHRGERAAAALDGSAAGQPETRRLFFPTHRLTGSDGTSRRRSLRHKTDSDSSAEGVAGGSGEGRARLSGVLDVMRKGRSTGSLSSSSPRSESERAQPTWRIKIAERLKLRLRTAVADDDAATAAAPGAKGHAPPGGPEARAKRKSIRRRHTMGGQRDFAELAVINDWREQGGGDQEAELSACERLKPGRAHRELTLRGWLSGELRAARCPAPAPQGRAAEAAPKALPEEDAADPSSPRPAPTKEPQERLNGGGGGRAGAVADAHPHKLSGAHVVVRSRFYQYL